jgi:hypothetical protein
MHRDHTPCSQHCPKNQDRSPWSTKEIPWHPDMQGVAHYHMHLCLEHQHNKPSFSVLTTSFWNLNNLLGGTSCVLLYTVWIIKQISYYNSTKVAALYKLEDLNGSFSTALFKSSLTPSASAHTSQRTHSITIIKTSHDEIPLMCVLFM